MEEESQCGMRRQQGRNQDDLGLGFGQSLSPGLVACSSSSSPEVPSGGEGRAAVPNR